MASAESSDAQSSTEISSAAVATLSSYLGVSFAVFLAFLPASSISYTASLQSRNRILTLKLFAAEDELRKLRSRRREDSRANARVAEIFAGHRHAWQQEEKRLVAAESSEKELRAVVEQLERDLADRDELIERLRRERECSRWCSGNFSTASAKFAGGGEDLREDVGGSLGNFADTEKIGGQNSQEERGCFREFTDPKKVDSEDKQGHRGYFGDNAPSDKAMGKDFRNVEGHFGNIAAPVKVAGGRREAEHGIEDLGDVMWRSGHFIVPEEDSRDGEGYSRDFGSPAKFGLESPWGKLPPPSLAEGFSFEKNGKLGDHAAFYGHKQHQQQYLRSNFHGGWQGVRYDSTESMSSMKPFVARREYPWKVGESAGVSPKLKLLEQELINLEKAGKGDLCKISSLMRKQAKRYQSLARKIDDLCKRMQVSHPAETTLSPEFRNQRQTEFLLEASHLQHRAIEIGQKLATLQVESAKSHLGNEVLAEAKVSTKRALDSIRNNFKEIQRNLEIWLARIIGDLEGVLARDGPLQARDYYMSRYPFVR